MITEVDDAIVFPRVASPAKRLDIADVVVAASRERNHVISGQIGL
jgi:hypothetical protein